MKRKRPLPQAPRCVHTPCLEPGMAQSPYCAFHWRARFGWDEATASYPDETLPFSVPVNDPDHAGDAMYAVAERIES